MGRAGYEAGDTDEAIDYAQASLGLNDSPTAIARACEEILLKADRIDEAYERFALETAETTGQSETIQTFLDELTTSVNTDSFVHLQLEAPYGVRRPIARA